MSSAARLPSFKYQRLCPEATTQYPRTAYMYMSRPIVPTATLGFVRDSEDPGRQPLQVLIRPAYGLIAMASGNGFQGIMPSNQLFRSSMRASASFDPGQRSLHGENSIYTHMA